MSKQIYIDSNGNEIQVSGTVNTADMMPMSGNDSTKVSTAIGDLSQLTTSVKSSLVGAVNVVNASKVGKWTYVNATYGNTQISLPNGWSEVYCECRFGNSNGLQAQSLYLILTPEQKGLTMTIGGATLVAQCSISSDATKVAMVLFTVSGGDYLSTSQLRVWYR